MSENIPQALRLYDRMTRWPAGRWLFSRLVCLRAPYFGTIRPCFEELRPGLAIARMRKRRAVHNHIGTVHAIAMANLCELVGGTMTEVTVPTTMRWIPKCMVIEYRGKAQTNLRARAQLDNLPEFGEAMDVPVPVDVFDKDDNIVVHAVITMYVSPRKPRVSR